MNSLLNYFIEANLYLVCFYLLYQILLARDKHFRFNRIFLIGGILLSILLPMMSFSLNGSTPTAGTIEGYILLPAVTVTSAQTESVNFIIEWWHIIGIIYSIGVLFFFTRLIWQMFHIMKNLPLLNSSRERKDGYTLVTTNGEIPTCSFFKYLFWDKSIDLNDEEKQQILTHELAHIRQWHSLDVLLVELLRTVFWFNPVVHLIKSRITEVHEYLADFHATKQIGVEQYSKLLTLQIFKSFDFALSNNFHKSQVLKRIRMLKASNTKSLWVNVGLLLPTLALLITVLSCDVTDDIMPQKSMNSKLPVLPDGLSYVDKSEIPTNIINGYRSYIADKPNDEILIVRCDKPESAIPSVLTLVFSESDWNTVKYFRSGTDLHFLISKRDEKQVIEEITFPEENTSNKEVFTIVEEQPEPIGGMAEFYKYIGDNLTYPTKAKSLGIEGKVFVQFVVDENGKLTDVQAVKGIGGGCDQEAVRVVKESAVWKAGLQRGEKVPVRMILPITFKMG